MQAQAEVLQEEHIIYTYADYAAIDTDERFEIIDGHIYAMAAPSFSHQGIGGEIFRQMSNFLKGKKCKVFISPVDVCLTGLGDSDTTVVQPDIIVVCDKSKIDDRRLNGAPDMAVEILSPSSSKMDKRIKYNKYQAAGVPEYWIVDPDSQTVEANRLIGGKYAATHYGNTDIAPVATLPGCEIDLADVFADGLF